MSKEDQVDRAFMFDVIRVVVGTLILLIISLLLQSWELERESVLGMETPATGVYLLIPVYIGLLTFGASVFLQGIFPLMGALLQSARQNQIKG